VVSGNDIFCGLQAALKVSIAERIQATIAEVRAALAGYVFRVRSEAELQAQVVTALSERMPHVTLDTEVRNGAGRFDILLGVMINGHAGIVELERTGLIVLELKVKSSAAAVERQAQRYAKMEGVDAVLVVTTSQRLAIQLADYPYPTLCGKPFGAIAVRTS
jgi:hypothetical protein